jgi:hypothetical protein
MRVPIYTLSVLLATVGFAQDPQSSQPKQQPTAPASPAAADKTTNDKTKDNGQQSSARPEELKTQSFSGTLMDVSCAERTASASAPSQACTISASTTQFGLQMKDGKTVKFDDVGNMRAQEAFKAHKKWSDAATANKPVRVKASGVLSGDKITVMSIN